MLLQSLFRQMLLVHPTTQLVHQNVLLGLVIPATLNLEALALQPVKPTHAAVVATQTLVALMAARTEIPVAVAKSVIQNMKTHVLLLPAALTVIRKTDILNKIRIIKKSPANNRRFFFNYLSVLSTGNPLGHQTFRDLQIGHNH